MDKSNTQIQDRSLSLLGTGTSMKSGRIKLVIEDNKLSLYTYVLKIKISGIQRMSEATISVSSPLKSATDQRKLSSVQDCNTILSIKLCTTLCQEQCKKC